MKIDGRWLVRDVSLAIEPARVTALVGPNGSGKSTVLRLLAGLWRPTRGRASMDGADLTSMARRLVARRVAFVPQDTHIGFAFSVREVVEMGRHPHVGRFETPGPQDAAAVDAALDEILESARQHGIKAGLFAADTDHAVDMLGRGYEFVTVMNDVSLMASAAAAVVKTVRGEAG